MNAEDIMSDTVYAVSSQDNISYVKNLFLKHGISTVIVLGNDLPIGVVNEADVADAFFEAGEPVDRIFARDIMRKKMLRIKPEEKPEQVAKLLLDRNAKAAMVYDKGLLGIITKTDLTNYFIKSYRGKVRVRDVMAKKVRTVQRQHSIFHAIKQMHKHGIQKLVVMDPDPVGIITARDIALATYRLKPSKVVYQRKVRGKRTRNIMYTPLTVADVMKKKFYTIPAKSDATAAAKYMLERGIGSLVVTERNKICGIITKTDIASFLAKQL